ncbi:GumC family protein [Aliagarivorans marinus]|uniref:GumC family protein n=1 Tax=Aliagarivorans marinus TaxID=561965 RepID=UPI0009FFB71E|nr:polysaccharide biosynthesis tyrosine autokinase [Aliagarivorans marinus]
MAAQQSFNLHTLSPRGTNERPAGPLAAEEPIELGQYWQVIRARLGGMLLATALIMAMAVYLVGQITPMYRATAVLLIEAEQQQAVSVEQLVGIDSSRQEYYLTQFELIKSHAVAQRVIDNYQLALLPEFNPALSPPRFALIKNGLQKLTFWLESQFGVELPTVAPPLPSVAQQVDGRAEQQRVRDVFLDRLQVNPIRKTQLVQISFESTDPQLAAQLANAVAQAYIDNNRDSRLLLAQEATTWLEERLGKLKQAVRESEARLSQFLSEEGLVDVSGIDSLASTELSELSRRLSEAKDRRLAAESLYLVLQENRTQGLSELSSVPAISNHPQLRDIRLAEVEAEQLVSELSKRYGPKHDHMIRARAQLSSIRAKSEQLLGDLATGIEKELRSARRQEASLLGELDDKKQAFQSIAVKRATYEALSREVESNRNLYDLFLKRQKETSATNDFLTAVARFTDRAAPPLAPAGPKPILMVVAAGLGSLLLLSLITLLRYSFHDTIDSTDEFYQKLALPPLGFVPSLKPRLWSKVNLDAGAFFNSQRPEFAEAIRSIRTSLTLGMMGTGRKCICVSSALPGEGKSSVAMSLAQSMASLEKVLLIEADLRRPTLGARFELRRATPGLTNIIMLNESIEDCISRDPYSEMDVLCAGVGVANPLELLASSRFEKLLTELEERYDKIVIDSPPILPVSDTLVIARFVGSVVIVLRSRRTLLKHLNTALGRLFEHNISVDGVVLNQLKLRRGKYYADGYQGYTSNQGVASDSGD